MELWAIITDDWTLPVNVEWPDQQDVARVTESPVALLKIQNIQLSARLNAIGVARNGAWWILRKRLEIAGHKTSGDPELQVFWHPQQHPRFTPPKNSTREFCESYCRTGLISDPDHFEVLWHSILQFSLSWMLNEQKAVPMGFCDLHPVPLRPNWKQMFYSALFSRRNLVKRGRQGLRQRMESISVDEVVKYDTRNTLLKPRFLFWCKKDKHMYWSIEARPKKAWWKMVKAVEMAKIKKFTNREYFKNLIRTIKRAKPRLLDLYVAHLQQISLPFLCVDVSIHQRLKNKGTRNDFYLASKKNHPTAATGDGVVFDRVERRRPPRVPLEDFQTSPGVPPVPVVQPAEEDVRDTGADMAEATANCGGRSGV